MSFSEALIVFISSLLLSAISSAVMARRLDQTTAWLRFPEGLVGLVTALGADTPEISSALTGIMSGNHELGLGVIIGSNIFNLAALLGVSAIISGRKSGGQARRSTQRRRRIVDYRSDRGAGRGQGSGQSAMSLWWKAGMAIGAVA